MSGSIQPKIKRTILRVEHLDDRLMPSDGVMSASVGVAWNRDVLVESVSVESAPGPKLKSMPPQAFAGGHFDEFGSKPGGTGEGIFGLTRAPRTAERELQM
jgi:hypothetical protein